LDNKFSWHEPTDTEHPVIDPYIPESIRSGVVESVADSIVIKPGEFILGRSVSAIGTKPETSGSWQVAA
jgi:dCTP deaminase